MSKIKEQKCSRRVGHWSASIKAIRPASLRPNSEPWMLHTPGGLIDETKQHNLPLPIVAYRSGMHPWGVTGASAHPGSMMKGSVLNVFNLPIFNNRSGYRAGIEDYLFEKFNRLSLEGVVGQELLKSSVKTNLKHATYYQPITCRNLKLILEQATKTKISFDFFIDIGSGKGKACFYAAQTLRCKKFIGIEFSLSLVKAAKRNKAIFGHGNIDFLNEDAAVYLLPEAKCLIFLYNPFNDIILEKFIANNYGHFRRHASIIAYAYDVHRETLLLNGFRTIFRASDKKLSLYQFKTPKALA